MAYSDNIAQRFDLFQRLSSLPVAQLEQVIFALNPPSGNVSPPLAPPAQRVTELLAWAESPMGCGLELVEEVLAKFIPRPPERPQGWFLAHPYPMPPNFTGRTAELEVLTNWLGQSNQPLYVLLALGGFGKSALTWHWLTHRVDSQEWPQVVWWSFYEASASFDNFLPEIFAYLTGHNPGRVPPRQQLQAVLIYLQRHPVLIVMDGFERELRAYGGLGAAYQGDEPLGGGVAGEGVGEVGRMGEGRECISPLAEEFLRGVACLPGLRGRVLMSTRLRPRAVEQHGGLLAGCGEKELRSLAPDDAVTFFRRQGVAGNRNEIERVCENYGFHPLSLRLVAGYIAQNFDCPNDIRAADSLDVTGDLVQRRNHVLARTYDSLPPAGRQLLGRIACFRSPVAYGVLQALAQGDGAGDDAEAAGERSGAMPLQAILRDLINRGLVQQETRRTPQGPQVWFDLHPIVRRYAYGRMATEARTAAHGQLRDYFATVPGPEHVTTLDDLAPVIELYHHMVRAEQYDEACDLFLERIDEPTYGLGAYQLQIELLRALFPQGEDQPPQLRNEGSQGQVLNALADNYSLSGQPRVAMPLFESGAVIAARLGNQRNVAVVLGNLAYVVQLPIGAMQAAEANLYRSIELCRIIANEYWEAVERGELGRLLTYRGVWAKAEAELQLSTEYWNKTTNLQGLCIDWAYRSLAGLLRGRAGDTAGAGMALAAAERSLELADETARAIHPVERDYVRAHWLLGAAHRVNGDLSASDTHLTDALTRCRTINAVDAEADILLDLARLRAAQDKPAETLSLAQQALAIADRCGYVLQGADINLFLAQHHLAQGDPAQARPHAQAAHRLATCDGGDHVYRVALDEATALLAQLA
ncbi:tetratricopeptide repeat protein [Nodosilinea sp. PGN35]|uniref:tetratricopeptide repeat protein n=1 Tax=Nodosilinea sp. PGN35 TaxID=3020489 RepID=UPI0023B2F1A2|nr:tetratricopeptide repeat protein [Nodosilinea sp. TSF1-S3]MDF0368184.1 tetratricopeptide repeat protein [Nodosilinea sp. TSF1-S3]